MDPSLLILSMILALILESMVMARDVPALEDICARGAWSFCPRAPVADTAPRPQQRLPAADVPPSDSSPSASANRPPPPSSKGEYCGQFQPHFMFFCNDREAKDQKAADFCSDYLSQCVLKSDNAGKAPELTGTQPPAFVPCATYRPQFTRSCTSVVTNPQLAQFCQNFQTYCMNGPSTPPPTPAPLPDAALAMAQIKDTCNEYRNAAKLYCTGPVTKIESAGAKQYCALYRRYCVATGFVSLRR